MKTYIYDAIIIGAGISGLSTAYYLKKYNLNVLILEKNDQVGGVISTSKIGSYITNRGPQTILLEPELRILINNLGLEKNLIFPPKSEQARYIANPITNTLSMFPSSLKELLFSGFFTPKDIYKFLREIFSNHKAIKVDDITIGDLFEIRFGRKLTENVLAAPFVGVWAASIWNLSSRSVLPVAYKSFTEGTSIIRTFFKMAKDKKNLGKIKITNLNNGLESIISELKNSLKDQIFTSQILTNISRENNNWIVTANDTNYITKNLILASNPTETLNIIAKNHPHKELDNLINKLKQISFSPVGVLQLSFLKNSSKKITGFGALIPPKNCKGLLGMIYSSCLFNHQPENMNLITCFCGGSIMPELANVEDKNIQEEIINQVSDLLELKIKPRVIAKKYWEKAIPIYESKHFKIENAVKDFENQMMGIHINCNLVGGVGIPARVRNSMNLASHIAYKNIKSVIPNL